MATNLGTLIATVGVDTKPLKKGLKDAERHTKESTSKMLSHWKAMATGIVATYAVFKMAKLVKETALAHARFETLGIVMKVVGKNVNYLAAEMDRYDLALRKTGISMIESRQSLARMAMAQLDLNKATVLGRIAQDAAVIGNINSSEAFQRMIYGIQTGNLIVLRRIGINVSFEQSYKDVAKATDRTTASFTEAEKAIIRQNAVIKYGARIAGTYEAAMATAGKKLTSFVRYVDDFKVKMGKAFGPATVMLVDAATIAMKEFQEQISRPEAQAALRNLSSQLAITIVQLGEDLPKAIKSTTNAIADIQAIYNSLPPGVVGAAGAGLIGRILFGGWGPAKIVAGLYLINKGMSSLGMGLGDIAKGYKEAADNFQKAWDEIIGKTVKGVEFFTIDWDENKFLSQFEKMQEMLAKGAPTRLEFALEDPSKYYGKMEPTVKPKALSEEQIKVMQAQEAFAIRMANTEMQRMRDREQLGLDMRESFRTAKMSETELVLDALDKQFLAYDDFIQDKDALDAWYVEKYNGIMADANAEKLAMTEQMYFNLKFTSDDYYAYQLNQLQRQSDDYEKFTGNAVLAHLWLTEQIKALDKERLEAADKGNQHLIDLSQRTADAIEDNFSGFFRDFWRGELDSAEDYFRKFCYSLTDSFSDMMGQMTKEALFGGGSSGSSGLFGSLLSTGISSYFGGGAGGMGTGGAADWSSSGAWSYDVLHKGGIVGVDAAPTRMMQASLFAHAPRLHRGLAEDEFPAILQKGETVIPRGQASSQVKNLTISVPVTIEGQGDDRLASKLSYEMEETAKRVMREEMR